VGQAVHADGVESGRLGDEHRIGRSWIHTEVAALGVQVLEHLDPAETEVRQLKVDDWQSEPSYGLELAA